MAEMATQASRLGQRVAFTGKLASMTFAEAKELVCACGAEWVATVNEQTNLLVVGQDGLPLRKDGRLTRNLQTAERLQKSHGLVITNEADWLAGLGSSPPFSNTRGLSTAQLSQMLKVPGQRIRQWVRLGLIQPTASVLGVHFFDFRQVSWTKTLCNLARAGVTADRLRGSLEQLRQWLPDIDQPLAQLAVLESEGRLVVRLENGQLAEASGQGLLDFGAERQIAPLAASADQRTAADFFNRGCELEAAGQLIAAFEAYRQALDIGGVDALTCFNLGNVLVALDRKEEALNHYIQAVEADPEFAAAWLNVGSLLSERKEFKAAIDAFRKALALDPTNADAHYNLADTLDEVGRAREALAHWRAYVQTDSWSPWGRHAKRRLGQAGSGGSR